MRSVGFRRDELCKMLTKKNDRTEKEKRFEFFFSAVIKQMTTYKKKENEEDEGK